MKIHLLRLVLFAGLVSAMLASVPVAFAQEHGGEEETGAHGGGGTSFIGGPNWDDAQEVTIWSLVAIGAGCALLGVFYLFKRKVGGFPKDPAWVAPISIMPASDLPGDDGDGHGHAAGDAHGHAPAH